MTYRHFPHILFACLAAAPMSRAGAVELTETVECELADGSAFILQAKHDWAMPGDFSGRGGYRQKALISSFVGAFPMNDPKFVVIVSLDEPKGLPETGGYATAGWVAARTVPLRSVISPREGSSGRVRVSASMESAV